MLPVAVSPGSDLIAYSIWREASCDPAYSLRTRFAVVVDASGEELAVLPGRRDGRIGAPLHLPAGRHPQDIAIGDLNHDGRPDLVTADSGSNTVSVRLNRGTPP